MTHQEDVTAALQTYQETVRGVLGAKDSSELPTKTGKPFDEAQMEALATPARELVVEVLEGLSLDVIEPCEPECDAVRHALHQGSWNAHMKIEAVIASYKGGAEK